MKLLWQILIVFFIIELVGIILFWYLKTRREILKGNFGGLLGYIKKHWIILACIVLFALIYPTILFVYIEFLITNGWLYLLALWPCLILLLKKRKTSSGTVLGIAVGCLFTALLLLVLWIQLDRFDTGNVLMKNSTTLFLGLSLFYIVALLPMFILKKKKICWWPILFIINTTTILLFAMIKTNIHDDMRIYHISDLTNIRTEAECRALGYGGYENKHCGDSWMDHIWKDGYCVKKSIHLLCAHSRAFDGCEGKPGENCI